MWIGFASLSLHSSTVELEYQWVSFLSLCLSISLCLFLSVSLPLSLCFSFLPLFSTFSLSAFTSFSPVSFRPPLVVSTTPHAPRFTPLAYVIFKISFYYTVKYELDGKHGSGRGSSCVFLLPSCWSQTHLNPCFIVRRGPTSTWEI